MLILLDKDQIAELCGNSAGFHGSSMGAQHPLLNPLYAE